MSQSGRVVVNYSDEKHEDYDNRLRILIINFLRDVNIPFSVVENQNFQDIIRHLDPSVTPPTFTSLVEMAAVDHEKFKHYEQLLIQDKCQKKIEKETGVKSYHNLDTSASTQLKPSEFNYGKTTKLPLNLKELPTDADLEGVGHYASDTGLTNWPCIVCLKRQSWSKVRTLTMSEASVFLYICVSLGIYPVKIAQKIYALRMLKCCSDHLTPVYEAALGLFGINHPNELNDVADKVIADAQVIVRTIKEAKYAVTRPTGETRDKYIGPFRNSLKIFFKNYIPRKTVLAGYVDVKPYCPSKIRRVEQAQPAPAAIPGPAPPPQAPLPLPPPPPQMQPYQQQPTSYQPYYSPANDLEFPDDFLDIPSAMQPIQYDSIEHL